MVSGKAYELFYEQMDKPEERSIDIKFSRQQTVEDILKRSGTELPITSETVEAQLAANFNTKRIYLPKNYDDLMNDDSE